MTWPSGRKYVGQWRDSKFNGYGTLIYAPNLPWIKATGNFVDGRHRSGVLVRVNGTFKGTWDEDGNMVSGGRIK
jgi:cation transport regulator ChaC